MYKVLIVDDEPFILEGLRKLIDWEEHGLEIVHACFDGIDALEYMSEHYVHILITDIRMSEMDGLELIERVRKVPNNQTKIIILSGFNDFTYVKEAILLGIENYLLKPISENELISTLKNAIQKIESELTRQMEHRQGQNIIRDNILHRWMMGDIEKKEFTERAAFLSFELESANYLAVVVMPLNTLLGRSQPKISNKSLLQFAIHNICYEIATIGSLAVSYCDPFGNVVIVYSQVDSKIGYPSLKLNLNRCITQINDLLSADVLISVGSVEAYYKDAHLSYEHAKKLEDYQLIIQPNTILLYDEIQADSTELKLRLKIDYKKLQDLINSHNREETLLMVKEIYAQFSHLNLANPKYIRELSMEILFQVKFVIRLNFPDSEMLQLDFDDLVYTALEKPTLEHLQRWIEQLLNRTFDFLKQRNEEQSPLIKRIKLHLEKHYKDDLNLANLAKEYRINPVYLGYLFKKETGELFNNCLNRVRIEQAVRLLQEFPEMKAADVALQVGYANANYFYTLFKKIVGVSPTHFRKEQ